MIWDTVKKLKTKGVLGINQRNLDFVNCYNDKNKLNIADDKLLTKHLAIKAGINTPKLYGHIQHESQVKNFPQIIAPYSEFAIKPTHGSGGKGIIIIRERIKDSYRRLNGVLMSEDQMYLHLLDIISGIYSLGGYEDTVMIEYRVNTDPTFLGVSLLGVPDIRLIVFLGYPIMAMARLPTLASEGKANLHQGAIGVGIDLGTGVTLNGVMNNETITEHPDTLNTLSGIQINHWQELLKLAAGCYELTGLGYIGVDIVIDRVLGPMVLEINARPGLNIQIANHAGLLRRLMKVEALAKDGLTVTERVDMVKDIVS